MTHDRDNKPAGANRILTRRQVLQLAGAGAVGIAIRQPIISWAAPPSLALTMAQLLNRARFGDLPPKAIEHGKMIIASTLASAASGSLIDSARIVRELEKDRGGKPEATVWFDGARLPVNAVAR